MDAVWNFFGDWNVDFCLASIPILLLFLHFYVKNREISLKDTLYFRDTMVMTLVTILFGIVGAAVCAHWKQVPYWLIYLFNVLYYIGSLLTAFCAFRYTMETLHVSEKISHKWMILASIPILVMICITITAPWHLFFFSFDPVQGLLEGPLYVPFYFFLFFYLLLCLVATITSRTEENKKQINGLILCAILIAIGIFLEADNWKGLYLPFFVTLGIACIYITVKNPDLFINKRTGLLSGEALEMILEDSLKQHTPCGFGFVIRSYYQCRISYGSAVVDRYLTRLGEYIQKEFPGRQSFYLGDGHFLVLSFDPMDLPSAAARIHQQLKGPWSSEEEAATFNIGCCFMDSRIHYSSPAEFREILELAFSDLDTLEYKDIFIDEKYQQRAVRQLHVRDVLKKSI